LRDEGLQPDDVLLDIGCGALRLGHLAVGYLKPGHYWGTDASAALMRRGWEAELDAAGRARLPPDQLVADADFSLSGVPDRITMAIAFGVFTHLPADALEQCLRSARRRLPLLRTLCVTLFLAPSGHAGAYRHPDGVVSHADRPPYHRDAASVERAAARAGFAFEWRDRRLPRGQRLLVLRPLAHMETLRDRIS
jgi:SAM-dependent methyltransferase